MTRCSDCALRKKSEIERIHREFIASLHVRNTIRAKEKLEELVLLAPLNRYVVLESHFELWLDVMMRSAVEAPEVADYCLINIFGIWIEDLEMFEDSPITTLEKIASILFDTKYDLLEYHPDATEVIEHLNEIVDSYAETANYHCAFNAEKEFYRIANARTTSEL